MDIAAIYVRKKYIDKGIPEKEIGVFYVTQCAAKIAAIKCPVGEESSPVDGVINMDFIYNKILLSINRHKSQVLPRVWVLRNPDNHLIIRVFFFYAVY